MTNPNDTAFAWWCPRCQCYHAYNGCPRNSPSYQETFTPTPGYYNQPIERGLEQIIVKLSEIIALLEQQVKK